jgi:hypothetical protein
LGFGVGIWDLGFPVQHSAPSRRRRMLSTR